MLVVEQVYDEEILFKFAISDPQLSVRYRALERLTNEKQIYQIYEHTKNTDMIKLCISKLSSSESLLKIYTIQDEWWLRLLIVDKLSDMRSLEQVLLYENNKYVLKEALKKPLEQDTLMSFILARPNCMLINSVLHRLTNEKLLELRLLGSIDIQEAVRTEIRRRS